jgi:tetratricopeptide (TPR) repeat protein
MSDTERLVEAIPRWLVWSRTSHPYLGLSKKESCRRARELVARIQQGMASPEEFSATPEEIDVLNAMVSLVRDQPTLEARCALGGRVIAYLRLLSWPGGCLGEHEEMLDRIGRALRRPETESGVAKARELFTRLSREKLDLGLRDSRLRDPEVLVSLLQMMTQRSEADPAGIRGTAEYLYKFLSVPVRPLGVMDEREYFLGELAMIAGGACRFLFRKDEARQWFDLAEANFRLTVRVQADLLRLAYQRLALRLEERAYEEIRELTPPLRESFRRLGMTSDATKCRFLEGIATQELGDLAGAIEIFEEVSKESQSAGEKRLYAIAENNLFMLHSNLGDEERALACSSRALKGLSELGNRAHLAKLQWYVGTLHRSMQRPEQAIRAYRSALEAFREIGMRGDVVSMHLVIADLLLDQGAEAQAEWEIRAALPIIDEEKMAPEGMAAYALLRESVRRRKIDRNALRDVHGYFQE